MLTFFSSSLEFFPDERETVGDEFSELSRVVPHDDRDGDAMTSFAAQSKVADLTLD